MTTKGILTLLFTFTVLTLSAQSFHFGPKGGAGIGYQQWNNSDRSPILAGHIDLFMETLDDDGKGAIYGQLGLHTRGSSIRVRNIFTNRVRGTSFRYQNISLGGGIKKRLDIDRNPTFFYQAGIRGEYTINTNLDELELSNINGTFPVETFVRKFNYGITVGGGLEFDLGRNFKPFLEFNFMPDLSAQYDQFQSFDVQDPFTGQIRTISPRTVRNITLEVTLGLKFLREVIYVN